MTTTFTIDLNSDAAPRPPTRRRFLQTAAATPLVLCLPTGANTPAWPDRPLRVIVPFPAGGTLDVAVRLVTQAMSATLGQPFVVDNKPGGGTVIGTALAAQAPADGLTLLAVSNSFTVNPSLLPNLPYDTARAFQPLGLMASTPLILCARPGLADGTLAGVVAVLKARPDAFNHASPGNGTAVHLIGEMLNARLGTRVVHVPFKGRPPALSALAGGQVDLSFVLLPDALPLVRAGKVVALGVASPARVAQAPDLPTLVEQMPSLDQYATGWFALMRAPGVPAEAAQRLDTALMAAMAAPEVRAALVARGYAAERGDNATLRELLASETSRYAAIIQQFGIRPE